MLSSLAIDRGQIGDFCRRWQVTEFALFGSILRADFGPNSDVDVLVTFAAGAPWTLWDLTRMRDELQSVFGRPVDLVEKQALRNPYRRQAILSNHQVLYAS